MTIRTAIGRARIGLVIAALLAAAGATHADGVTEGQELARQAIEAEESGDAATAVALFKKALEHRPNHPGLIRRIAAVSLAAGNSDEAMRALEDYLAMGLLTDLDDAAWSPLSSHPRWNALRAKLAANARPVGQITVVATIAEPDLIAEGLAFDASNDRFYVGSVHKRKILAVKAGAVSTFIPSARDGLLGVFGLALDRPRNTLWAATSALPQVGGLKPDENSRAGLFAFDLDGRLKMRAMLPADEENHVLGDLTATKGGDVYTTDSFGPTIYRLRAGGDALEVLMTSETFHSLQGLALPADETRLAVADYSSGIHIVDLSTKTSALLAMPPQTTLHGVDALIRHGRDLLGVQNGVNPQRVIRIRLNPAWTAVEGVDVIAANLPDMDEPTLATPSGGDLLVIGNGQWSRFKDDGAIDEEKPAALTRIVRLKLPKARP